MVNEIPSQQHAPIGVMDSGVGGLSVLREIHRQLPAESLLYVADSAHLPYGDKSPAFVRERVNRIAESLIDMGSKALVVACNTATAAAVESLRERFAVPVIGMEPGVKPAVLGSKRGVVGILATEGMVQSNRMHELVQRFARDVEVVIQPCPGLVEQVERHALHTPETSRLLQGYLAPILERQADTLVLGCTHYPFLQPLIEHLVGPSVTVIDTATAIAHHLKHRLEEGVLLNDSTTPGSVSFYSSGNGETQRELISTLWGKNIEVTLLSEIEASPLV
ncbi:MAG: glutamate racemase [Pseudomonadota bacterium]